MDQVDDLKERLLIIHSIKNLINIEAGLIKFMDIDTNDEKSAVLD